MKLILGAAQFGSPYGITNLSNLMLGDSELNSLLDCAFDHGITTIDTAESYGQANKD
jgi:aryl-alcohol dehydrogenase-like predicted oxidoreductase